MDKHMKAKNMKKKIYLSVDFPVSKSLFLERLIFDRGKKILSLKSIGDL